MAKVIRSTYPLEFSVGLLLLIFVLTFFLSHQIFAIPWTGLDEHKEVYIGMFLVATAVVIMALILWEEFLFPVKIKPAQDGMVFRNHSTKLKTQLLIYCTIPVIFGFIYSEYEVNHIRFFIWAIVCIGAPVAGKLISGINNYNDFLKLTDNTIEYKNNEKEGVFEVKSLQAITLIKDEGNVLHKIQVSTINNEQVIIDLDEMELEAFLNSIDAFIKSHYKILVKETRSITQK